ncbi:MAG: hypothetical protein Q8T13_20120 [Acidobacteriota bacterium]|nr:hypothetical protein [Acidobacteriota bacterium]
MTFEDRVAAIASKGYTDRQARFLVTVLLHSGVCMVRQYCEFSGIARGQKTQNFFSALLERKHASFTTDPYQRTRIFHVQHRSLYEAIGQENNRNRKPVPVGAAIERLMLLDAVIGSRDLDWLATEQDKLAHFTRMFGTTIRREELPRLVFGEPPRTTTRYFPDKLPIGVSSDGQVRVFTFLVTGDDARDFRKFLQRHAELLRGLPAWRVRLLIPAHLAPARQVYLSAFQQELLSPMRLSAAAELQWLFEAQRTGANDSAADQERLLRARLAFGTPRFRLLYRRWRNEGAGALSDLSSPALADAMARGTGKVEAHVLPHPYFHLRTLVGTA